MGWKENFSQAGKELLSGKVTTEQSYAPTVKEEKPLYSVEAKPMTTVAKKNKTVIAEGTTVVGNVQTENDLELYGTVQGDILGRGNLMLQGKISGNVSGNEVELRSIHMKGDLTAAGLLTVDSKSAIEGNVKAQTLKLFGKIDGDVTVAGLLSLMNQSSVVGNIKAGSLLVEEGASVQGEISIVREAKKEVKKENKE